MAVTAELGMGTRAVCRPIEAGTEDICPDDHGGCGGKVKFSAQVPLKYRRRVIANIYWHGRWNRTEFWHLPCYVAAGFPYGLLDNLDPVELQDLVGLLAEGIEPTSDLLVIRLSQMSKARKDPAYRPPAVN